MDIELDHHDHRILAELQAEARLPMTELGRRVHLSQPAVTERVRKLEEAGVIAGYHAVVDPAKLGYAIRALIRIGRCDDAQILHVLENSPETLTAFKVTGEDNWMMELAVRDVPHLKQVLERYCEFAQTSTSIILRAVRERSPITPHLPKEPTRPVTPVKVGSKSSKPRRGGAG